MAAASPALGEPTKVTLSATPGNRRLVNIPAGAKWVRLRSRTGGVLYLEFTGADESAKDADDFETEDIGVAVVRSIQFGTLCLSGDTASQVVEVTFTDRGY